MAVIADLTFPPVITHYAIMYHPVHRSSPGRCFFIDSIQTNVLISKYQNQGTERSDLNLYMDLMPPRWAQLSADLKLVPQYPPSS